MQEVEWLNIFFVILPPASQENTERFFCQTNEKF